MLARTLHVLSVIVLVIAFSPGRVSARDDSLEQEFLTRYEPAARKLAHFYTGLMLRARRTAEVYMEGRTHTYEYIYRANGELLRLDEIGYYNQGTIAWVANPSTGGFVARRPKDKEHFFLLGPMSSYDGSKLKIRQFAPLPCEAYCAFNMDLVDYIRLPNVCVVSLTSEPTGTETLERLVFEWDYTGQGSKLIGTLWFAPQDCWVVRRGELRDVPEGDSTRWTFEYRGKHDGVPLVHKLERIWADRDGRPTERLVVEVTELVPGAVPEREFTLAAFGLSDAGLQETVPTWYYWQLAAVLALLAAVVFWRLSKRGRPVAPPPASAGA